MTDYYKSSAYIGLVNDAFPERLKKLHEKQYLERGFDDTCIANLDITMALFIAPRIRRYSELTMGVPPCLTPEFENTGVCLTLDGWKACLNTIADALESIARQFNDDAITTTSEQINYGLSLLNLYFRYLYL